MDNVDVSYALDGRLVAQEIVHAGASIKKQIRGLISGEEKGITAYTEWIHEVVANSPEVRWATLDSNYIIARTLLNNLGEVARSDFSNIVEALSSPTINLSVEERAGVLDASVILLSKTALDGGLKDDWLWYASKDCRDERYMHLMGTIIAASCSLITLLAKKNQVKPISLWDHLNK